MNTKKMSATFAGHVVALLSPEARGLMTLGQERGWDFFVLGQAPLPREQVRLGDWMIVPVHQDTSTIPARALERVQAIYAAGLRPQGFVLVHEAPKLLSAPKQNEAQPPRLPLLSPQHQSAIKWAGSALAMLTAGVIALSGLVLLAIAAFVLLALLATVILPMFLLAGVALYDPILIAVTEDGYWVEVDRWLTQ